MRLEIENIGRVDKADIEIQGITVVAGVNSTGKSTVSKALYSVLELSDDMQSKIEIQKKRSLRDSVVSWKRRIPFFNPDSQLFFKVRESYRMSGGNADKFVCEIKEYARKNMPDIFWHDAEMEQEIYQLFEEYCEITDRSLEYYRDYISQVVLDDIFAKQINCMEHEREGTIRYIDGQTETLIRIQGQKIKHMDMEHDAISVQPVYITTPDLTESAGTYRKLYSAERNRMISYANSQLLKLLMKEINSQDIVAEKYYKIEEQKQQLQEVLQEVLEGELYFDSNRIMYHDSWCNKDIELSNVASGMKVFLILKKLVDNGVFLDNACLIIDEPETNLHPEWQLKLARLLVLFNHKLGVRIYLNSHSPYFVRAIEYYSYQYQVLEQCNFYEMKKDSVSEMFKSECVTDRLGVIYDKMAEPFNMIM